MAVFISPFPAPIFISFTAYTSAFKTTVCIFRKGSTSLFWKLKVSLLLYLFPLFTFRVRFLLLSGAMLIGKLSWILKGVMVFIPVSSKSKFPSFLIDTVLWGSVPIGTLPKFTSEDVMFKIGPNTFTAPVSIVAATAVCSGDDTTNASSLTLKVPGKVLDFSFKPIITPELPLIAALASEYTNTLITPSEGLLTASACESALLANWCPLASSKTAELKIISNCSPAISSVLFSEISKSKLVAVPISLVSNTMLFWATVFCIVNTKKKEAITV